MTQERTYHERNDRCRPCGLDPRHCDLHEGWFTPEPAAVQPADPNGPELDDINLRSYSPGYSPAARSIEP